MQRPTPEDPVVVLEVGLALVEVEPDRHKTLPLFGPVRVRHPPRIALVAEFTSPRESVHFQFYGGV